MADAWVRDGFLLIVVGVAAITDLLKGKVPNWVTYPAVVAGLAMGGIQGRWSGLGESALGLAVGFVPLFIFYRMGSGLGGGDVKLMAGVGALRGYPFILFVMFYSFIVAAVLGMVLMVWRRQSLATFGRIWRTLKSVLTPGAAVVSPTAPDSIQVPFAACVCLGTAWALVEFTLGNSLWEAIRRVV